MWTKWDLDTTKLGGQKELQISKMGVEKICLFLKNKLGQQDLLNILQKRGHLRDV